MPRLIGSFAHGTGQLTHAAAGELPEVPPLRPILVDARDRIIDGRLRHQIDPDWPTVRCEHITTDEQVLATILVLNEWREHERCGPQAAKKIAQTIHAAGVLEGLSRP